MHAGTSLSATDALRSVGLHSQEVACWPSPLSYPQPASFQAQGNNLASFRISDLSLGCSLESPESLGISLPGPRAVDAVAWEGAQVWVISNEPWMFQHPARLSYGVRRSRASFQLPSLGEPKSR